MPRRRDVPKREPLPDPIYNSGLVSSFINVVMKNGKKATAEQIVYRAFAKIQERASDDPLKVFKKAVDNVKPTLEVKSRRVGGSNYQVPVEVRPERRMSLSLRWLASFARARPEKSMVDKIANELMDAAANRGAAVKKREDTHRMAEANKAFAHYRW
ncbi:MAG TPA: 30S ribosomal protein S7 [Vicinamibacteria bacterium]|nr:30S ribosomal protein S7 [Vicinamibacteria bacterium]HXV60588.1 30S ribosomal protein S7 [Vicinamibacteria bacterium]